MQNLLNETDIIILKPITELQEKILSIKLMGKTFLQWLEHAICSQPYRLIEFNGQDVLSAIKHLLGNKKYTAVLFLDTPLLSRKTFCNMLEYFSLKKLQCFEALRGFVFLTDYAKSAQKLSSFAYQTFEEEDFLKVQDYSSLAKATGIMQKRINSYHINNGVQIVLPDQVYIEAEVSIGGGTIIYPNNCISGNSKIGKNCVLNSGNIIDDCYVESGLTFSYIIAKNAQLNKKNTSKPFTIVE